MSAHTELVNAILLEFGARPGLRLWKVNVGAARTSTGALVRYNMPGMSDIMGILAPSGRMVSIEVKTGAATRRKNQRKWGAMIEKHGGLDIIARSLDDVRRVLA
jgi:hypothetical protein